MANTNQDSMELWDTVIEGIYSAALDPGAWADVVERASSLIRAEAAMAFAVDWTAGGDIRVLAQRNVDPDLAIRWQAEYLPHDIWSHAMRRLPAEFVATGASVVDSGELRTSPIYGDILRPLGADDLLSASLGRGAGVELVISFYSRQLFDRAQARVLERLAPHLRKAVHLQRELGVLRERASAVERILGLVGVGVLLLARDGRVVWANEAAEAILRARDGLGVRDGRLRCARSSESAALAAAVVAAAGGTGEAVQGSAMVVSRPSLLRSYAVSVAPLPREHDVTAGLGDVLGAQAAVLLTVTDPEQQPQLLPERVARVFGLTPAEARLAVALASEQTLQEYADTVGITIGTARWTLKQVLEKTGCRRQSELVHRILTSGVHLGGVPEGDPQPSSS